MIKLLKNHGVCENCLFSILLFLCLCPLPVRSAAANRLEMFEYLWSTGCYCRIRILELFVECFQDKYSMQNLQLMHDRLIKGHSSMAS